MKDIHGKFIAEGNLIYCCYWFVNGTHGIHGVVYKNSNYLEVSEFYVKLENGLELRLLEGQNFIKCE